MEGYKTYSEIKQKVLNDEVTVNFVMEFLNVPFIVARCLVKDWKEQQERIEELTEENKNLKTCLENEKQEM